MAVKYTRYREAFDRLSEALEECSEALEGAADDFRDMAEQGREFREGRVEVPDDIDEVSAAFEQGCLAEFRFLRDDTLPGWQRMFDQRWLDYTEQGRVNFMDEFKEIALASIDSVAAKAEDDEFVSEWLDQERDFTLQGARSVITGSFDYERETRRESFIDDVKQESASLHKELAYDIAAIDHQFMSSLTRMDEDEMAKLLAAVRAVNKEFAADLEAQQRLSPIRAEALGLEESLRRSIDQAARRPNDIAAWKAVEEAGMGLEAQLTKAQDVVMGILERRPDKRASFMESIGQPYQSPISSSRSVSESARNVEATLSAAAEVS